MIGHEYKYAVEQIMLMLFPEERPTYPETPGGAPAARISLKEGKEWATAHTAIFMDGKRTDGTARIQLSALQGDEILTERLRRGIIKMSF